MQNGKPVPCLIHLSADDFKQQPPADCETAIKKDDGAKCGDDPKVNQSTQTISSYADPDDTDKTKMTSTSKPGSGKNQNTSATIKFLNDGSVMIYEDDDTTRSGKNPVNFVKIADHIMTTDGPYRNELDIEGYGKDGQNAKLTATNDGDSQQSSGSTGSNTAATSCDKTWQFCGNVDMKTGPGDKILNIQGDNCSSSVAGQESKFGSSVAPAVGDPTKTAGPGGT